MDTSRKYSCTDGTLCKFLMTTGTFYKPKTKTKLCGFGPQALLVGEVVPTFLDRGCCVVSATDPPGR
jgi:hypothetical protein